MQIIKNIGMAKKTTSKHNIETAKESKFKRFKSFFTNERSKFIVGLIISFVTIYIALALISFFFTGGADQSKIENIPLADLVINRGSVDNWTGVRGAYLADLLMNKWFGISSFLILFFLGCVGAKLMSLNNVSLIKRFLFSSSMLIWGSLFFAFAFVKGYEDTFLYLGGQHGYVISEIMMSNIGIPGTVLLLLGTFLIIAIFTSKRTIPFLQKFFSFSWIKIPKLGERKKKQEDFIDNDTKTEVSEFEESVVDIIKPTNVKEDDKAIEYVFDTESEIAKAELESSDFMDETLDVEEEKMFDHEDFEVEVAGKEEEISSSAEQSKYDPRLDLSRYVFPPLELLKFYDSGNVEVNHEELAANQQMIKQTLEDFSIRIASIKATVGPTVTLYEIVPEAGVRISKIKNLEDDIALSLSALQIRIIAPMPGKGTIGIEVPNKKSQIVSMQSVIASRKFQECTYDLPVVIGKTIVNEAFMFDLCKTPHLLVAGATGQGKSVGLNAIITSLLYRKHPAELKFVMIDPKRVEFSPYSKLERHYLAKLPNIDKPIVTEPEDAVATLNSLVIEMENRYELLVNASARNIKEYKYPIFAVSSSPGGNYPRRST